MRISKTILCRFRIIIYFFVVPFAAADQVQSDACEPGNGITPICGFSSPEDIDVLEQDEVLVVGGFNLAARNGDLRSLHLRDGTVRRIFYLEDPKSQRAPTPGWGDPNCPGFPTGFAAHGIHVSNNANGSKALLVVNHSSREAVEWFEIEREGTTYRALWRGCTVLPDGLWINDIARLPDGGFVASHMMSRSKAMTMFDRPMNDGLATGYVLQWSAANGWQRIAGSEGALPNGIAVSADGNTIYNNHYLANQTIAIDRRSGERIWVAQHRGAPDNLSVTPDGRLLVTMHLQSLRDIQVCLETPAENCGLRFANAYLDPVDGKATPVFEAGGAPFGSSTVAVQVGGYIYMGAFDGQSVGRIAAP